MHGVVGVVSSICDLKFRIWGFVNIGTRSPKQWDGEYFAEDVDAGIVLVYAEGHRC